MDYQPTQNDTLTFRASFMHWNYTLIGSNNLYAASDAGYVHEQDFGFLGSWNHIFGPALVNQVRVQVVPYNNVNEPSLSPSSTELSIGSLAYSTAATRSGPMRSKSASSLRTISPG